MASTKTHKKQQSGLDGHSTSGSDWSQRLAGERRPATNQYLVLEDLTSQYKQPCVLDLKLGTRQHGLNETAEKIKSKTAKVKNSTSSSLGLRVCGMQVYHPGDKEFLFRDKYFGRSIDAGAFEENLLDFLYNGGVSVADASANSESSAATQKRRGFFREDLVPLLVERLEAFKKVVGLQTQYRFYSSSLLLLYEGAVPADYDPCTIRLLLLSSCDVVYSLSLFRGLFVHCF
jgi:inositol-hexakisphosphate kinase